MNDNNSKTATVERLLDTEWLENKWNRTDWKAVQNSVKRLQTSDDRLRLRQEDNGKRMCSRTYETLSETHEIINKTPEITFRSFFLLPYRKKGFFIIY
ncbi:MAG: hypothetical protein K2K89_03440 [Ruminococcus sp.]|nr:hypothetical protein [Ruminococcus sp.]